MAAEWPLFLVTAVACLGLWFWLLPACRPTGLVVVALVLLGLTVAGAAVRSARQRRTASGVAQVQATLPREGRATGGYVSSGACRACHPSQYASWYRSFHRTMTQYATPATVKAPFAGMPPFAVEGGTVQLQQRGDSFWMTVRPGDPRAGPGEDLRIGMVTGSHHLQVFWAPDGPGNRVGQLPYAYLLADQRWVPSRDTFLVNPDRQSQPNAWNLQCIRCHATAGQPQIHAAGPSTQTVEMGIACESCHGPGAEHVRRNADPWRRYQQVSASQGDPTIVNPRRLTPRRSSEVCGQCHSVSGIRDPQRFLTDGVGFKPGEPLDRYKPPLVPGNPTGAADLKAMLAEDPDFVRNRFWPDGTVRVIGREWSGMARSRCHLQGGMTCLSCHSLHESDRDQQLAPRARGDEACLQCHGELRPRIAAHTHHPIESAGSRCQNCHMPHTTFGLLKATRSHFVDSPRVASAGVAGRPNACNLCHLDRSLGWTATALQRWYGQPVVELTHDDQTIAAGVLLALRGDAAARALVTWAMGWPDAQQASGTDWLPPFLIAALGDSYAAVRYVAERSLRTLPAFAVVDYDYVAPPDQMGRSVAAIADKWRSVRTPVPAADKRTRLLLTDGDLDIEQVNAQLANRDDRPLELTE